MLTESLLSRLRHMRHHNPRVDGVFLDSEPYLSLPFIRSNLELLARLSGSEDFSRDRIYRVTEGWMYSIYERAVHGRRVHGAVDYYVPYGAEVAAPCDGIAVASYHRKTMLDKYGNPIKYKSEKLRMGLGYFVQIWTGSGRIVQLGHLSNIVEGLPFSPPTLVKGDWIPTNHTLSPKPNDGHATWINKGDLVGRVGLSGLLLSGDDYVLGHERPLSVTIDQVVSWDEPHLHFEEAGRSSTGKKVFQRCPYDVYLSGDKYLTHTGLGLIGENTLFITDQSNLPKFAG